MNTTNYWKFNTLPVTKYANQTLSWYGSDSRENFLRTLTPGYDENSIVYQFNSHGFRTSEFEINSSTPSIICIGCSFTMGTGLRNNQIWPVLLQNQFPDYRVYNFGIGGNAGDSVARTLYNIGGLLNTKIVCILWPEIFRYEIYKEHNIIDMSALDYDSFTPDTLTEIHYGNLREKNRAIVNLLKDQLGYRVIESTTRDAPTFENDWARDSHPGPKAQQALAKMFADQIQSLTIEP
jgi:hypothetical protein